MGVDMGMVVGTVMGIARYEVRKVVRRHRHVTSDTERVKMSMVIEQIKIYWNKGWPCAQWATCTPEENHAQDHYAYCSIRYDDGISTVHVELKKMATL